MGLLCRVADHGCSPGQNGRQHDVDRGAYADHIQEDIRPSQVPGLDADHILRVHRGAQGLKALQMQIDGTETEVTSPGKGHLGAAKTPQQNAQQIIGSPHLADALHIHTLILKPSAVNDQRMFVFILNPDAHLLQNGHQILDIGYMRNIL